MTGCDNCNRPICYGCPYAEEENLPCYEVRFDEDAQNMNETFKDKTLAIQYARDNISDKPVMYYIDEDGNEEVYSYFDDELYEDLHLEQTEQN